MANYLMMCVDSHRNALIEPWLSLMNQSSTDLLRIATQGENTCYYLAHAGQRDGVERGRGGFKGYAIDHERSQIIFSGGNTTAPSVHWPMPGKYIRFQCESDDVVVGNDLFAQLPMLYFAENGIVAISDSIFVLVEIRRLLDLPNKVNMDVALSRAWIHGMA